MSLKLLSLIPVTDNTYHFKTLKWSTAGSPETNLVLEAKTSRAGIHIVKLSLVDFKVRVSR